jgi:hypothetical protein
MTVISEGYGISDRWRAYRRDTICATQRFQEQRFVNFPKNVGQTY